MVDLVQKEMTLVWAETGDIIKPDDTKISDGWDVELVPRQWWNWMQNRVDHNIAYLLQKGFPEWSASVEYIINKSYVQHLNVVYKCIQTHTNHTPAVGAYWVKAFAESSASLEALHPLTIAADQLPYFTGPTSAATTTITAFARSILDDTSAAAVRTTIGAQPLDATLTALSGVATGINKLPYFTGTDIAGITDLSAFGRSLIDDVDAAAARDTLGAAPIDAPEFTGIPTGPTAAAGTSTTQLATTAFVSVEINTDRPYSVTATDIKMNGVQSLGSLATIPRADHVHPSDTSKLSLTGGTVTGSIILSGPQATYNYAAVHDSNGEYNVSRYTKAGVWNATLFKMDFNGVAVFSAGVTAPSFTGALAGNASSATTLTGLTPTVAELNYVDGVTSSIQTQLNALLPLAGGTMTGTITNTASSIVQGYSGGSLRGHLYADANGFGILSSLGQWAGRAPIGTNDWLVTGTCTAAAFSGPLNGAATTLSGNQTNWATLRSNAVANMLGWKNYGNGHVIFDASAGTAPDGTAINSTNATQQWSTSYPTLMGWNGTTTYGVRVDSARIAGALPDTGWITLSLYNGFTHGAGNPLQIRRIGNVVYACGLLRRATPPAGLTEFATIPSGYRPSKTVAAVVSMNADNFNWVIADIGVGVSGGMGVGLTGIPTQNNATWGINFCWETDYA